MPYNIPLTLDFLNMVRHLFPNLSATMLKRFLFLLPLLFVLFLGQPAEAQNKSYYWERYDVDITLLENGDLRVVESQTLTFFGDTFSSGYVTIPTGRSGNNDGITDITVSEDNTSYKQSLSGEPYTFTVGQDGDNLFVDWYFPPTVGTHTYVFSYTAQKALRIDSDLNQIFWKAIPAEHGQAVLAGTMTIHLPEAIAAEVATARIDGLETPSVIITPSPDRRQVTFELTEVLTAYSELEIGVQFPAGQLTATTSDWQRAEQISDVMGLIVLFIAILLLVGLPLLMLTLWFLFGRDPQPTIVPDYLAAPPSNLPPAIVGTLVDERADMQDILSTLVDLARRGYITMQEVGNNDFLFQRNAQSGDNLRHYENYLLDKLFQSNTSQTLSGLRYKFSQHLSPIQKDLYNQLKQEGFVNRSPDEVRNNYGCLGLLMGGLGFIGLFALPALNPEVSTMFCPAVALLIGGLTTMITARAMPAKTQKGADTAAQWLAFKKYLQEIEKYTNLQEAGEIFEAYLGYAIAFGLERTWITKFSSLPNTRIPRWYVPTRPHHHPQTGPAASGTGPISAPSLEGMSGGLSRGLEGMSGGLTRMLTSANTILQSTTPPSSSGGGSRSGGSFRSSGGSFRGRSGGGGSRGFR